MAVVVVLCTSISFIIDKTYDSRVIILFGYYQQTSRRFKSLELVTYRTIVIKARTYVFHLHFFL